MRILLLTRSFNSLSQRLYVSLARAGHELAVEFDIADAVTEEAVALFRPDLIVAPYMKRAIPASVWQRLVCLVVHPGIVGDRGPSALDWAILEDQPRWGVTVLQAEAEMDAGPVWASRDFAMRPASKSSLYRNEVTDAAVDAVLEVVASFRDGVRPLPVDAARVRKRPAMTQEMRRIDWRRDPTDVVLRKLRAADGVPGVLDELFGEPCYLHDGRAGAGSGPAGALIGRRNDAVLRATVDGAVWIGHCRRASTAAIKLPVGLEFTADVGRLPELPGDDEVRYEQHGDVGVLHFGFYNGAMSTMQCERLLAAFRAALLQPTRVLLLAGGTEFFSNGIHLNVIEAADSAADESWRNINAMDDLCEAILDSTGRLVVAALQGNAGAGGAFLAFTADEVWARDGVLLNPHYKNMGNLYGSEYWTYTLPRRVKQGDPRAVMQNRLPIDAGQARDLGLVDVVLYEPCTRFLQAAIERARRLAAAPDLAQRLAEKAARRARDEARRPLASYRAEELERMRRNFYGFDSSYHVARSYFVHKTPPSWTPRHLARHRDVAARAA